MRSCSEAYKCPPGPWPGVASPFIFGPLIASPLPYLALMAPKGDQLSIQSYFGNPGQGRQVVEVVKPKRGRPSKPRPAAQPAQEGRGRGAATGTGARGHSRMTGRRACEVYIERHE